MSGDHLFNSQQQGLPSMELTGGAWVSVEFVADLYGVTEQTIRDWAGEGVIEKPMARRVELRKVIRSVYRWQRRLIETVSNQDLVKEKLEYLRVKSELMALQVKKKKGQLLDAEMVQRVALTRAKREASQLNALPSRLKSILAAETDEFKVGQILQEEVDKVIRATIEESGAIPKHG